MAHELTGQKFGRLLVVELTTPRPGKKERWWKCLCECGNQITTSTERLNSGYPSSCGCLAVEKCREVGKQPKPKLPPGEAGFKAVFMKYKWGAKKRNLEFALPEDQFRTFVTSNCHYCGVEPLNVKQTHSPDGKKSENSKFLYNGVDRLDPEVGYLPHNCVTACTDCNFAKQSMTHEQFLAQVSRIYKHLIETK